MPESLLILNILSHPRRMPVALEHGRLYEMTIGKKLGLQVGGAGEEMSGGKQLGHF